MKTMPEHALDRLLDALVADLMEASDDEIAEVLAERGIKLGMKGSAALLELIDPGTPTEHTRENNEDMRPSPAAERGKGPPRKRWEG
jgi:hypothetical protein